MRWAYLLSDNGLWDVFGSRICVGKERKCRWEKRQKLATKLKKNFLSFLSTHPTINQIPNSALGKVGTVEGLNLESWYWTIIAPCPLTRKRHHPISRNSRNWYIFPDTGWLGELYCTKEGQLVVWRKENHKGYLFVPSFHLTFTSFFYCLQARNQIILNTTEVNCTKQNPTCVFQIGSSVAFSAYLLHWKLWCSNILF